MGRVRFIPVLPSSAALSPVYPTSIPSIHWLPTAIRISSMMKRQFRPHKTYRTSQRRTIKAKGGSTSRSSPHYRCAVHPWNEWEAYLFGFCYSFVFPSFCIAPSFHLSASNSYLNPVQIIPLVLPRPSSFLFRAFANEVNDYHLDVLDLKAAEAATGGAAVGLILDHRRCLFGIFRQPKQTFGIPH